MMIYAVIVLSVCILLLLIALLLISVKCIDLNATSNALYEQLGKKEEMSSRARKLILDKFDFYLPESEVYLAIAENELRKEQE